MLIKCICKSCAGHLEFEEENAGQKIKCPHCGFDTTLYLPGAERAEAELATLNRKLRWQKFLLLGLAAVFLLGGLGWCLYHWGMPFMESLFPSVDSPLLRALMLMAFCLGLPLLLLWLLLPIFLFLAWRRFLRLVASIEQHLRPHGSPGSPETTDEVEPVEEETPAKA
jgi:hypothetical protein